jgi:solute:Na+ symporter, SSS family
MGDVFTTTDLVIFFVALIGVMAVGWIAGRKEDSTEDYFLAGKQIPWWGVAGSIFGSNVSANHMVGMLGIGFSIGFAQSHFELGAIAGLMVLCYGFLPVYRKLKVYTLSEYLEKRYDSRSRLAYAIIMLIIMAIVQMVPAIYIGARSSCFLIGGNALVLNESDASSNEAKPLEKEKPAAGNSTEKIPAESIKKINVNMNYYVGFVIALSIISASYTIFGGLKAVIWTDVIQSVLMLIAGIAVAIITFNSLGGWSSVMNMDLAGEDKMHLYLPSNDKSLPWTGVFTGLMAMHCFYWGTNQFIVQRALAARNDSEGRLGIIVAGFMKLLIPFFAIGTGVASIYLFRRDLPNQAIAPDTAFSELVKLVILPLGPGLVGLISAGLIGAILSSIDSMMNSASTIVSFDIYKKYLRPDATDKELILAGRISIVIFVFVAALMAIFVMNPNSEENFFLTIVDYQGYFTPGILVVFFFGMFWKRGTANAAIYSIVTSIFFSWVVDKGYEHWLSQVPAIQEILGEHLNFFHRVVFVLLLTSIIYIVISLNETPDQEKSKFTWMELGGHSSKAVRSTVTGFILSLVIYTVLAVLMVKTIVTPKQAAAVGSSWTFLCFVILALKSAKRPKVVEDGNTESQQSNTTRSLFSEDRFWAGILCSLAVYVMYAFY